ncbi:MAG: GntR family transcriptional regulator [Leptolyngbya sp. SIO1D8]|nr:GntR family transcriptional regulator [Leptolyngbya sp. SIO1D8]
MKPNPLPRREALHEQTYQALRTCILSGELAAGDRLVETHLAKQLEVSRTPVREAMRQLQREGLVTADPNGGVRVITVSIMDTVHLYNCRIALEKAAVQAACTQASDETLQQLELSITQAERAVQRQPSTLNTFEMLNLDYQFHRSIADSSGNPWLTDLLDQVFDKMMLLRVQTTRNNPKVLDICTEHRKIHRAIESRSLTAATEAIETHLEASKQRVIATLQALQTDSAEG